MERSLFGTAFTTVLIGRSRLEYFTGAAFFCLFTDVAGDDESPASRLSPRDDVQGHRMDLHGAKYKAKVMKTSQQLTEMLEELLARLKKANRGEGGGNVISSDQMEVGLEPVAQPGGEFQISLSLKEHTRTLGQELIPCNFPLDPLTADDFPTSWPILSSSLRAITQKWTKKVCQRLRKRAVTRCPSLPREKVWAARQPQGFTRVLQVFKGDKHT
ncbi:uncharacterized protein LOC128850705 isoform X1 [Cuculus canorus]|uniref:uncharacterized protein LOC128850705 isoform X1 n=1 Tax=Cuculus canorus TaxID=55661 RepID=UPI0023AB2A46|nr:uncharacterized protein LOC128850705 isoform X1 [Cuculus canorus]XP_053911661.1 uncharacterized protein LOC128850705 isoform X1 [Cuculus canorus]